MNAALQLESSVAGSNNQQLEVKHLNAALQLETTISSFKIKLLNAALQLDSSQLEAKNNHALGTIFVQKFIFYCIILCITLLSVLRVCVSLNFRYTSPRMRVNTMEDDSVFEEEGEERDSFVQPARGLRSFALVSWLFIRTWKLSFTSSSWHPLLHIIMQCCGSGSRIRILSFPDPHQRKYFNPKHFF